MSLKIHPTALSDRKLAEQCQIKQTRGSGPGGQHRNKVQTAIVITHLPSGVIGQASERRSQNANHEVALERLRVNLAIQVRLPVDENRTPSELWQSRVQGGRLVVSIRHRDFATLLAEAIDFIEAEDFDVAAAAKRLLVSTSQLVKLLKLEPAAFQAINSKRQQFDLHPLK